MPVETTTTLLGVKYSATIAGFMGSIVALTFIKELTFVQLILAIITGCSTSTYVTPLVMYYFKIPVSINDGIAFLIGILAMNLIPALIALIDGVRKNAGDIIKKHTS